MIFRDESDRVIRKAQSDADPGQSGLLPWTSNGHPPVPGSRDHANQCSSFGLIKNKTLPSSPPTSFIVQPSIALLQPINDLAASFFFANYALPGPPISDGNHDWLVRTYGELHPRNALRVTVEAVGMAGMANIFHDPYIVPKAQAQYGQALRATSHALRDPVEVTADTTLMATLLLGLFEVGLISKLS